jgi:ATP-dependent Clp protease protease subunit
MADVIQIPTPKERVIYLADQVDQSTINNLTKSIIEINDNDEVLEKIYSIYDLEYKPKPIKIYVDSYGGYVYQCFGLLSVMNRSKTPIHTIVTGCAMSCGFLIAISGHKRFGYEKSTFMYHQLSSTAWGKVKDIEEDLAESLRLQKMIEDITLEKTGIPKKKLENNYKNKKDWFMDSKTALKNRVIDEII